MTRKHLIICDGCDEQETLKAWGDERGVFLTVKITIGDKDGEAYRSKDRQFAIEILRKALEA